MSIYQWGMPGFEFAMILDVSPTLYKYTHRPKNTPLQ